MAPDPAFAQAALVLASSLDDPAAATPAVHDGLQVLDLLDARRAPIRDMFTDAQWADTEATRDRVRASLKQATATRPGGATSQPATLEQLAAAVDERPDDYHLRIAYGPGRAAGGPGASGGRAPSAAATNPRASSGRRSPPARGGGRTRRPADGHRAGRPVARGSGRARCSRAACSSCSTAMRPARPTRHRPARSPDVVLGTSGRCRGRRPYPAGGRRPVPRQQRGPPGSGSQLPHRIAAAGGSVPGGCGAWAAVSRAGDSSGVRTRGRPTGSASQAPGRSAAAGASRPPVTCPAAQTTTRSRCGSWQPSPSRWAVAAHRSRMRCG